MMGRWMRHGWTTTRLAAWVRLAAVLELLPAVLDSQLRRDAELTPLRLLRAGDAVRGTAADAADDGAGRADQRHLARLST